MRNSAEQWERFGRADPYYGVYSVDEFRRENLDDAATERFFRSGDEHVESVLETIGRLVDPGFAPRSVLDHGCGVGRLVIPFARRAERVVGVDVASSMLAEARRNCDARGLQNVELMEAGQLGSLAPEFDLVHSFIVLQHVPTRQGVEIFDTLASLVVPGGVGVVQVPIAADHWLARLHSWATRTIPYAANAANVVRGRGWSYPHMEMNVYTINTLAARLQRQGIEALHLLLHPGTAGRLGYASATLVFERPASTRS